MSSLTVPTYIALSTVCFYLRVDVPYTTVPEVQLLLNTLHQEDHHVQRGITSLIICSTSLANRQSKQMGLPVQKKMDMGWTITMPRVRRGLLLVWPKSPGRVERQVDRARSASFFRVIWAMRRLS